MSVIKSYSSKEIKRILENNGWYVVNTKGDHWQFKHPTLKGRVTLTHPVKDVEKFILRDIERKSGIKF